jgi:putative transcriptional regulator
MTNNFIDLSNINLKGKFLIATPSMPDNRFFKSVIFITNHSKNGAMGIVINKQTAHTFKHLLKNIDSTYDIQNANLGESVVNVSLGGPINSNNLFIIHSTDYKIKDTIQVCEDISMTNQPEIILDLSLGRGPKNALIGIGCATWEANQLEKELIEDSWIIYSHDFNYLFSNPPYKLYEELLENIGINKTNPALFSNNKKTLF